MNDHDERPEVHHAMSADGLTLTSVADLPHGRLRAVVEWEDPAVAAGKAHLAMAQFEARVRELTEDPPQVDPMARARTTRVAWRTRRWHLGAYRSRGGPVWRWPRLWVRTRCGGRWAPSVGGGWLWWSAGLTADPVDR